LKYATRYDETFTMYYSLSTNVVKKGEKYSLKNVSGDDVINEMYFRTDRVFGRSNRFGNGGDNTGMLKLNYHQKNGGAIPPEGIDVPEIEFCNTCYYNVPIQFVFGQDGVPLPEAVEKTGRWCFLQFGTNCIFHIQRHSEL